MEAAVVAIIGREQMEPVVGGGLLKRGNSNRRLRCFTQLTDEVWVGMISRHSGNDAEGKPSPPIPEHTMGLAVVCVDTLEDALRYDPDWVVRHFASNGGKRFTVRQDALGCPKHLMRGYREITIHDAALCDGVVDAIVQNIVGLIHDAGERSLRPGKYREPVPWVRLKQRRHALRHH